jgi:hypothetical protein
MGKTQEETMNNPFIPKDSELHALTRAEEENCYKDMKAKALEHCQLPIKGTVFYYPLFFHLIAIKLIVII